MKICAVPVVLSGLGLVAPAGGVTATAASRAAVAVTAVAAALILIRTSCVQRASDTMALVAPGQWTERDQRAEVWPGRGWPLGATWSEESTNFAVSAPEATCLWVCVFDDDGVETRHQLSEHTLGIWHGAIPDVPEIGRASCRERVWNSELVEALVRKC